MRVYEYTHFTLVQEKLELILNQWGSSGWRLFSCAETGTTSKGTKMFSVVMERTVEPDQEKEARKWIGHVLSTEPLSALSES